MKTFFRYLVGKRSELADLETKDALLAKVVLDIHRKRTRKDSIAVPLFDLHQVHALDRPNAAAATEARIATVREHADALRAAGTISNELLAQHLPSVSWIKVVEAPDGRFLAFEGNGRIAALQTVFRPEDDLRLEVERYRFDDATKILRRLARIRRLNGFDEP